MWLLYLGYYDLIGDERGMVWFVGDGKIFWMVIEDLGFGNVLILVVFIEEWVGKMFYLLIFLEMVKSFKEVVVLVFDRRCKNVVVDIVGC